MYASERFMIKQENQNNRPHDDTKMQQNFHTSGSKHIIYVVINKIHTRTKKRVRCVTALIRASIHFSSFHTQQEYYAAKKRWIFYLHEIKLFISVHIKSI